MESRGLGKILSEPKGVTQNNQKLTVEARSPQDSDSDKHQQYDFH